MKNNFVWGGVTMLVTLIVLRIGLNLPFSRLAVMGGAYLVFTLIVYYLKDRRGKQ